MALSDVCVCVRPVLSRYRPVFIQSWVNGLAVTQAGVCEKGKLRCSFQIWGIEDERKTGSIMEGGGSNKPEKEMGKETPATMIHDESYH